MQDIILSCQSCQVVGLSRIYWVYWAYWAYWQFDFWILNREASKNFDANKFFYNFA